MKSFDCKQCKVAADRSIFLTGLFKKLSRGGKEQTAQATVIHKRMASARFPTPGNTWDRIVKFRFSDGKERELYLPEDAFKALSEGAQGQLTWEGDSFLHFE